MLGGLGSMGMVMILLVCSNASVEAQVPYGEYETWIGSDTAFQDPVHWSSLNEVHHALGYSDLTVLRSDDALEGSYAMELHTRRLCYMDSLVCYLVPGVSVLGELIISPSDLSITTPGIAFTGRPESLNGYFKYFPVEDDSARIVIELSAAVPGGERKVVGRGTWTTGELMTQYHFFNIPIQYASEDDPDKLRIFIYSGIRDMEHPAPYPIGSRLLVDWVKMGPNVVEPPPATGLFNSPQPSALNVYPQPAQHGHYIETSQYSGQTLLLEVWDLHGRLLASQAHAAGPMAQWVNWNGLGHGQYRLVLRSKQGALLGTAPLLMH